MQKRYESRTVVIALLAQFVAVGNGKIRRAQSCGLIKEARDTMNKIRHRDRLGTLALLSVVLGAGILFTGCGTAPENEGKPVSKVETKASPAEVATAVNTPDIPAEAASTNKAPTILEEVEASEDLFTLHDIKEAYEQNEEKSDLVIDALAKQRDKLVAKHEPQSAIDDYLDFVTFEFKKLEGETHLLRWYFIVKADNTTKWTFNPTLKVDPSHVNYLPEDRRKNGALSKAIHPATTHIASWKKGEHKVLSLDVELKEIPYDISSQFYQYFKDKPMIRTKPIRHGWHVDLGE